jgi:hypothetical protein
MSITQFLVASSRLLWSRVFVLATWALFVVAVLLLRSQHIFPISQVIDIAGSVGFGLALAWFFLAGRWKYACMVASLILLLLYFTRWVQLIQYIHVGSPELGVAVAVERLAHLWADEFASNAKKFGLGRTLLEVYWDVAMPFFQLMVIAILSRLWRDNPKRNVSVTQ